MIHWFQNIAGRGGSYQRSQCCPKDTRKRKPEVNSPLGQAPVSCGGSPSDVADTAGWEGYKFDINTLFPILFLTCILLFFSVMFQGMHFFMFICHLILIRNVFGHKDAPRGAYKLTCTEVDVF